jgi:hypothetical protein
VGTLGGLVTALERSEEGNSYVGNVPHLSEVIDYFPGEEVFSVPLPSKHPFAFS